MRADHKVRTPLFPTYAKAAALIRASTRQLANAGRAMISSIQAQRGSPQNPVDWSDPDTWIEEPLTDDDCELASRIWRQDHSVINPRHAYGPYLFINNHELIGVDESGQSVPSARGTEFLNGDTNTLREIDDNEGLIKLLSLLAGHELAKRIRGKRLGARAHFRNLTTMFAT